jgi:hypothetical protein
MKVDSESIMRIKKMIIEKERVAKHQREELKRERDLSIKLKMKIMNINKEPLAFKI